MKGYLLSINQSDTQTAITVREKHARPLMVVEAGLETIASGLSEFEALKQRPDNPLEVARLFLATRSFKSLRVSVQVLERGYYQQAMTLVRMSMEDQLVVEDAENHPPTLDALLKGDGKLGRGDLSLAKMAERVSTDAKCAWDVDYGSLSEFAAHPRFGSIRGLVETGPQGQPTLRFGGYYDELWVNNVLYHMLRQLALLIETVAKLTTAVGSTWSDTALGAFNEVNDLWRNLDCWASQQLQQSLGDVE